MKRPEERQKPYLISHKSEGSKLTVLLSGELDLKHLTAFIHEIRKIFKNHPADAVEIDFSGVTYLDSAAALGIIQIQKGTAAKNIDCRLINLHEKVKGIFSVIIEDALTQPPFKAKESQEGLVVQFGEALIGAAHDLLTFILFCGELLYAIVYILFHPRSLRRQDVLFYMKRAGVDGLPIVGLISLLIGLIIAFMSFLQLRLIGANIYVPALVSFAMVKELGPIMTAILVAGRSGSAFAAEIGTMVVNEEVDALHTMGFDPINFLAVPKVFAAMIVVPILTLYSDLFGIVGGLIVGVTGLDLTFNTYITQSLSTITVFDVVTSMIKAAVFAVLIAGIGCQRGFQAQAGAQDVGRVTTSAVVSGIFLIVVTDSIFAIILYYIR
ncbi:MAG: ABC transporter permease [Deltaproteobacteria bacterium]|nr:ABC transporter permease [Deltaproteobacteria bacterium]